MNIDDLLAVLVYGLVPFSVFSAAVLVWAARQPPRIGALTERAVIAVIIAVFISSIALLVYNTETGRTIIDQEAARIVFRVSVLLLGLVPVSWVILWLTGRLGE